MEQPYHITKFSKNPAKVDLSTEALPFQAENMEKGTTISHYQILEKLGEGGMGVVYKARDTKLSRDVALKFISGQFTAGSSAKARFIREARAASALDHPNVSVIHEIGETEDGHSFICMGYYGGQTLKEKLENKPPDIESAVNISIKICRGLQCAHDAGITHRDIKPANIIITDRGEVKIVDFGLAKLASETAITETKKGGGTLAYMSPEQLQGKKITQRTDLYSLGILLYEMLTGRRPFHEEHVAAVMYSIVNVDPPPPSLINRWVPKELDEIILRLIKKNPDERYEHAFEVEQHLQNYLDSQNKDSEKKSDQKSSFPKSNIIAATVIAVLIFAALILSRNYFMHTNTTSPDDLHLVVLPFVNVGDDLQNKPFSDGLMETLTSSLTLLQPQDISYWVVSSSEVRQRNITSARDALREFNATIAVYGSVQRLADHVRLTLNLVDTQTSRQIRSEMLSVPVHSLPSLQDEAVRTLAKMLDISTDGQPHYILSAGGTSNSRSYEFYLEGRGYLQDYENIENINRAISLFERAIEFDPYYSLAHAGLGEAYWRKYDDTRETAWVERAIQYGNQAQEIDNSLPAVHITMGMIMNGTGRYEEAVQSYRKALELDPVNADAFRGIALAYVQLGNFDDAEETYKRALQLRPSYWAGYNQLGGFYLGRGRLNEAITQYEKVIELLPLSTIGYSNLGVVYYFQENYPKAIEMFNRAVEIEPRYEVYSNLGTLYFYETNYAEAAEMYLNALDISGHDYRVWGNLASALKWAGDDSVKVRESYEMALTLAEEEKNVNPRDAQLIVSIAGYYTALGEYSKARNYLSDALEIAPDNANIIGDAGRIYEQFGERSRAIALITNALEQGYSLSEIKNDPYLNDFRNDSAYVNFIQSLNSD